MAIQYQFAAAVLYCEVAACVLFCLPFISNRFWSRIFKWKIFNAMAAFGSSLFMVVAGILALLFFDSINQMAKYERLAEEAEERGGINTHDPHTMKFRAQRNFYITMFAFVFWIVLRRLIALIAQAAHFEIQSEALGKQAQSASKMAEHLMDNKNDDKDDDSEKAKLKAELKRVNVKYAEAVEARNKAETDLHVVKGQAAANNKEYDRLMAELEKCQKAGGEKKDE